MHKRNKIKIIVAFAIALTFILPTSAIFVNDKGTLTLGDTIVSIDPSTQIVDKEESFTVDVYVEPGEPISGVQFDLYFDQTIIQAVSVTEGDLFSGHTVIFEPGTIDNGNGTIKGVYGVIIDLLPLPTDPDVFCTISFTSLDKIGISPLDLDAVIVIDYSGDPVPIVVNDGIVAVGCSPEYFDLTISVNGHGTTVPTPGVHTYIVTTVVNLEAIPDLGWSFDHWDGDVADPYSATTNITMDANKTVTAYFIEDHYILNVSTIGNGHVDVVPDKAFYLYGEEPELTAVADLGWDFDSWSGDLSGSNNPETINMTSDKDVTATFTEEGDTIPPHTEIILDGTMGEDGWYVSVVTVTLVATDEGSGVESTWYRLDNEYWTIYSGSFVVSKCGYHTVEYYSLDHANNREDINTTEFKNDAKPPVTTHKFDGFIGQDGWFVSDVTVTLSATDTMTGVNYTKYKLDGGEWTNYTYSFVVTENGTYTLCYYSVDFAGGTEDTNEVTFKLEHDVIPPVTTHEFDGIMGDNDWFTSNVVVVLSAEDDSAGVDHTMYKLDEGEWTKYAGLFIVTEDSEHTITYYSVDRVGNKENDSDPFGFKIDKTVPTIELTWDGENSKLVADVDDETSGVAKVEFYVNGDYVGEDTIAPYEWEVTNPKQGDKGQAIVYDNAGNENMSKGIDAVPQGTSQSQSSSSTSTPLPLSAPHQLRVGL